VFALNGIDPILGGFSLVTEKPQLDGDPFKLEAMARRWSRRIEQDQNELAQFRKQWDKYQRALFSAVDYLHHRFPVYDESYLPSANMLATLTVFFFHHPGQPNARQAAEIRKWFWATGLAKRYSGAGYHSNISADAKFFESLACGARTRFALVDLLDPVSDIQGKSTSWAQLVHARSFVCSLRASPGIFRTVSPFRWIRA